MNKPWLVNTANPIDELYSVRGKIADLEKVEKELTEKVKALGAGEHRGNSAIAVITATKGRTTIDADAVMALLGDKTPMKTGKEGLTLKFKNLESKP